MQTGSLKRAAAACLAALMAVSMAACSSDTSSSSSAAGGSSSAAGGSSAAAGGSSSAASAETPSEPVKLTMIMRLNATYVLEGNPIIEEWGKRTNTILEIEAPPINNYSDRLNIVMASGDLPDIMYLGNTSNLYQDWASQGLLLKIDDYWDSMPNAKAVLTEDELASCRVATMDNALYSLPRVQTKPWDNIIYRKDWLDKLGLEVPATPKEFADVALAFTKQDPDGNGKEDTYGWSYNGVMGPLHRNLVNAFGLVPTSVPQPDGTYLQMEAQPGYMEFMDWMVSMYQNGSLDPEWYLTKMYEDDDKFTAGKIGLIYSNKVTEHVIPNQEFVAANPNYEFAVGAPLRAEGKTVSDVYYSPQVWGNYAINADCKEIDAAVKFLDYGYTTECNELLLIGMEGVTYTSFDPETRFAEKTPEQKEAAEKYCASYATINYQRADKGILLTGGNTKEENDFWNECYNKIGEQTNRISYLGEGSLAGIADEAANLVDINAKNTEMVTKYICGQITRDEFVNFTQNEYIPAYAKYMEIVTNSGINK